MVRSGSRTKPARLVFVGPWLQIVGHLAMEVSNVLLGNALIVHLYALSLG